MSYNGFIQDAGALIQGYREIPDERVAGKAPGTARLARQLRDNINSERFVHFVEEEGALSDATATGAAPSIIAQFPVFVPSYCIGSGGTRVQLAWRVQITQDETFIPARVTVSEFNGVTRNGLTITQSVSTDHDFYIGCRWNVIVTAGTYDVDFRVSSIANPQTLTVKSAAFNDDVIDALAPDWIGLYPL